MYAFINICIYYCVPNSPSSADSWSPCLSPHFSAPLSKTDTNHNY